MKKLCVALVAAALGAVMAAPASAALNTNAEGNKIVQLVNVASGRCLDEDRADRAQPSLNACTGSTTQQFERIPAAEGGEYLRNVGNRLCVDASNWRVARFSCGAHRTGQRFEVVPDAPGTVKLKIGDTFADTMYYDEYGDVTMESAIDYNGQRWQAREVGVVPPPALAEVVRLKAADYQDRCVSENASTGPCSKEQTQAFRRVGAGGGTVALRSVTSGKCLTNTRFSEVLAADCVAGSRGQQWTLTGNELGQFELRNEETARYLTPSDGKAAAYPYWSIGNSQLWELPAA